MHYPLDIPILFSSKRQSSHRKEHHVADKSKMHVQRSPFVAFMDVVIHMIIDHHMVEMDLPTPQDPVATCKNSFLTYRIHHASLA